MKMTCTPVSTSNGHFGPVNNTNISDYFSQEPQYFQDINISTLAPDAAALTPSNVSYFENDPHRILDKLLSTRVVVAICIFGLLGNLLNLVVLTRNSLKKTMHRMEKSSLTGLVALSLSDMLFCVAVIPQIGTYRNRFAYKGLEFIMLYRVYSPGILNTFIMLSTWLTVTMAMQRYLAICHPIKARQLIGVNFAKWSVVVVFLFSVVLNLPRFFVNEFYSVECLEGFTKYFIWEGPMKRHKTMLLVYLYFCFAIGLVFPIIMLTYCNVQLIRALQRSSRLRRMCSNEAYSRSRGSETTHRITLTLIIIVVMYTILVTPAEVMHFLTDLALAGGSRSYNSYHYNFATSILNTAQSINFAFNFILYCVINTHFRKTLRGVLLCPFSPNEWSFKMDESSRTRLNSLSTKHTNIEASRIERTRMVSV